MLLGLDLSTSIIGMCILDCSGNVVKQQHIDLRKEKTFFDKIQKAKDELLNTINSENVENIWIEQSLQAFRPGFSSAKTLLTLSKFSGIIEWIIFSEANIEPKYLGASAARKSCGIKIERGKKAKEVVMNFLLDNEPSFMVEYTKFGNIQKHFYDIADAIIIAKAGFICQQKQS